MKLVCPFCEAELPLLIPEDDAACLVACETCLNPLSLRRTGEGPVVRTLPQQQDLRAVLPPESLGGRLFALMRERLDELPILPEVSQKVLKVLSDADSSMGDLAKVIREDAVIAAKVLQVSNSAAYGGLEAVTELDAACTRLGQSTISNIVQTLVTGDLFESPDPGINELMKRLWHHSVATALAAGELATVLALPKRDMIYLQGLLHDIGKVAMLDLLGNDSSGLGSEFAGSPDVLHEILARYQGLVGLHVIQRWNLAPEFLVSTYCHWSPDTVPADKWLRTTHVVALANKIADISGFDFNSKGDEVVLLDHPSTSFLKLTDIKLAGLRVDLEERLDALVGALMGVPVS